MLRTMRHLNENAIKEQKETREKEGKKLKINVPSMYNYVSREGQDIYKTRHNHYRRTAELRAPEVAANLRAVSGS